MSKPKTAYDVRRYLTLVQVLTLNNKQALRALCEQWDVPVPTKTSALYPDEIDWHGVIVALALHVEQYHNEA